MQKGNRNLRYYFGRHSIGPDPYISLYITYSDNTKLLRKRVIQILKRHKLDLPVSKVMEIVSSYNGAYTGDGYGLYKQELESLIRITKRQTNINNFLDYENRRN